MHRKKLNSSRPPKNTPSVYAVIFLVLLVVEVSRVEAVGSYHRIVNVSVAQ